MRVTHLIPTNAPGGHISQLSLLLSESGTSQLDHSLLFWSRDKELPDSVKARLDAPISAVRNRGTFVGLEKLRRCISQSKPDILHIWQPYLLRWEHFGMLHRAGGKTVCSIGNPPDRWIRYPTHAFKFYVRKSDHVVFSSTAQRDFSQQFLKVRASSVVYPSEQVAKSDHKPDIRQELGIAENSFIIGAAGRLLPGKRLKDLIWSIEILKTVRDDIHLVIWGDGPQRKVLQDYACELDLLSHIHFIGWETDFQSHVQDCLCLVSCSDAHGISACAATASSAGIPFVSAGSKGVLELFVNGKNSLLFGPGDSGSLARCINNLVEDPALSGQLVQDAKRLQETALSPSRFAEAYSNVFNAVVNE